VIGWEDYTVVISFVSEGFPLQWSYWRVIYCNGLLFVFPTQSVVNFLINFTLLTATYSFTYLSKAQYSLFVLKVPLNPNQSIVLLNCREFRTVCVGDVLSLQVSGCERLRHSLRQKIERLKCE